MDNRSILIETDAVAQTLAFIKTRSYGVMLNQLVAKYHFVENTILPAISILEEHKAVSRSRQAGCVIRVRQDQSRAERAARCSPPCADSGIRKVIEDWIAEAKQRLARSESQQKTE
jgi:DNA-binding GntR family transcriptional regulator